MSSRHGPGPGLILLAATVALTLGGAVLYARGLAGWAQFAWVCASGTAGAMVMSLLDGRG